MTLRFFKVSSELCHIQLATMPTAVSSKKESVNSVPVEGLSLCKCYTYLVAQVCDHLGVQAWDQDVDH